MVDIADPDPSRAAAPVALTERLLTGGARILQLRMKRASASSMLAVAELLRPLCRAHEALLIINDRVDVALACGADGVHLGQDDLPLAAARRLAPQLRIGVSTHSLEQARAAAAADYIGFGPVYPTESKENPDPVVGTEALASACLIGVPVVAIGGITLDRLPEIARAGASAAAIIRAVNGSADIASAARFATRLWESLTAG